MPPTNYPRHRYEWIDECLRNRQRVWSREALREHIEDRLAELPSRSENGVRGYSPRSLDQDIREMKPHGSTGFNAPIAFDKARGGYIYTDPSYSINKNPLRVDDVPVLRQALTMLQQFQGLGLSTELDEIVGRVERHLNQHQHTEGPIVIQFEQVTDYAGKDKLRPLYQAIHQQQALRMKYQPFGREPYDLVIHPYLLKEYNHRWFLLCHCEEEACLRIYALDRILALSSTLTSYQPQYRPDPEQHFRHVIGPTIVADGQVQEVLLRIRKSRAPYILTKPLHHSQLVVEEGDNCVDIMLRVIPNPELMSLLLGFGPDLNVLSPVTLRQEVARKHRESVKEYIDCDEKKPFPLELFT